MKIKFIFCLIMIPIMCFGNKLVVTNPNDTGENTLRSVIQAAQKGDTIVFNIPNPDSNIITLDQELSIPKSISINGINTFNGDTLILKQLKSLEKVLTISWSNTNVTIDNLKITNGTDGAINLKAGNNLTLNNCHVFSNISKNDGNYRYGAIFTSGGSKLILNNCKVYTNSGYDAAGIYVYHGVIEIHNSFIYKNTTKSIGPTIRMYKGKMLVENCRIYDNTLGISTEDTEVIIKNTVISGGFHRGNANGGGLSIYGTSEVVITDSEIVNNYAGAGTGIYASQSCDLIIKRSNISGNKSNTDCSGIYFAGNRLLIDSCLIQNNQSFAEGGGICINGGKDIVIDHTIINNNRTTQVDYFGGGISAFRAFKLMNSTISNNSSDLGGGIFYGNYKDSITLVNNTFYNNTAQKKGGALYANLTVGTIKDQTYYLPSYPGFILINNTITNNSANEGGGVYLNPYHYDSGSAIIMLFNNIISNNNNGDIVRNDQTKAISSLSGSNNIGGYAGNLENYNLDLINYNSGTVIFTDKYPLLKNNGGFTNTIEIPKNSIAKGAGVNYIEGLEIPTFDQRGYKRNSPMSIGAYEFDGILNDVLQNRIQTLIFRIENETIHFENLRNPMHIQVFDMYGRAVYNGTISEINSSVKLYKGLFIVKIGNTASKILI